MEAKETGERYNRISAWWNNEMKNSSYGLNFLRKAVSYTAKSGKALDIGCGCNGRMITELLKHNFIVTGLDVSYEMIKIAEEKFPMVNFINEDFIQWTTDEKYDLIIAWDSTFHSPKEKQEYVIKKMCSLLANGGILIFTSGCANGEITGEMNGVSFYYSSLDLTEYLKNIIEAGCEIIYIERDQYPAEHMVFICKKIK